MTGATRSRMRVLRLAALLLGVGAALFAPAEVFAQASSGLPVSGSFSGSLTGRLTDLHSSPLPYVTVILRNQATGAEMRTTTASNGAYRFSGLAPGAYSLTAQSAQRGVGELEDIQVAAGHEARVQAAVGLAPVLAALPATGTAASALPASEPRPAPPQAALLHTEQPPGTEQLPALLESVPAQASVSRPVAKLTRLNVQAVDIAANLAAAKAENLPLEAYRAPSPAPLVTSIAPASQMQSAAQKQASAPDEIRAGPHAPELAALHLPASLPSRPAGPMRASVNAMAAPAASIAAGTESIRGMFAALAKGQGMRDVQNAAQQSGIAAAPVTTTISGDQLQSLPVSGRRWQDLFLDTPASGAGNSQLVLRGAGQVPADTTVDGASTRLAFGGASGSGPGLPAQDPSAQNQSSQSGWSGGWSGGHGFAISSAAVREVRVVAGNVEAEGAHAAGGRAGVETMRGGNPLHGQAFFFDRQNTWGAQNPFTQWAQNTGTAAAPNFAALPFTPPDHETSWGVGAGSRIRRDRLFWFAALDGYRRNDPGVAMAKHPIGTDQYGDCVGFFCPPSAAQIQLLSAQLDETENQANNDYLGVPRAGMAGAGLEQLAGLLGPAPRTAAQWVGFVRLDWQAAERHRFTLEGTGADWNAPGGGLTRLAESYANHSFGSSEASQEWLLARWEAFLTPNLLAVTQGSAGREILSAKPDTPSNFEQNFLGSGWNPYGQLPQIVIDSSYGFTAGNPSRFGQGSYPDERMMRAQEMVDWVRGKLLVKAGVEFDHDIDTTTLLRNQTGTYTYSKVENFISDALAFEKYGTANLFNFQSPHNCDVTGKAWYDSAGELHGLGALPCYSYFSQVIGPSFWQLSTNDWAGYVTAQWQLNKFAVFSAGLRLEREQLPAPIAALANPELTEPTQADPAPPLRDNLPNLGNEWGPRISLALGNRGRWPVLRLGYGMYFGRTENATVETALTQTGSLHGDLYFFIRPNAGVNPITGTSTSGAPPFPSVLTGPPGSVVTPGASGFAPSFHNPEVHQAVAAVEQELPGRVQLTASALLSLGRRLPVFMNANLATLTATQTITYNVCDQTPTTPINSTTANGRCGNLGLGPIKAAQITVPFYALWPEGDCPTSTLLNVAGQCGWSNPDYQQIMQMQSRANSTYEAAVVRITRYGRRGLSLNAHYTYAHAMDWNPGESPLDPALDPVAGFRQEYGASNLDVRHSAAVLLIYEAPWKLHALAGKLVNGWMLSGIGQFHSGLPYSMRVSGSLAQEFTSSGAGITGLGPGMNGSGGDSRVFGLGSDNQLYNIGRNTYRYPQTWKADLRLGKKFFLGENRELELLAESFNLFNHQNVTEIETTGYTIESGTPASTLGTPSTLPSLNFLSGLKVSATTGLSIPAFGQPLNVNATNFYRERQFQLGARFRF